MRTTSDSVKTGQQVILLPVSGRRVVLQAPTGAEDLLLLEAPNDDTALALLLMSRLVRPIEIAAAMDDNWSHLTATDLDVFVLRLRQWTLGDRVVSDVRCQAGGCLERIDISFGIDQYIGHHLSTRSAIAGRGWVVEPAQDPGWWRLVESPKRSKIADGAVETAWPDETRQGPPNEGGVVFRLPTVADLMAVANLDEAPEELSRRCIRSSDVSPKVRRRVESAMEAMAPILSQDLQGVCPACGAQVTVFFDPRRFCLRELRDRAAFVYQDVDILARRYHWAESDILALPRVRRMSYADAARQDGN